MNVYDQAARFAAKADPAGFLRWLVPGLPPGLEFRGWLDARTLPFPGEPDRTCDTVAELVDPSEPGARWALATEFQAEPDPEILDRLLEYLARLRRELRHGPGRRGRFRVAAGLVHLTGPPVAEALEMTLPGGSRRRPPADDRLEGPPRRGRRRDPGRDRRRPGLALAPPLDSLDERGRKADDDGGVEAAGRARARPPSRGPTTPAWP